MASRQKFKQSIGPIAARVVAMVTNFNMVVAVVTAATLIGLLSFSASAQTSLAEDPITGLAVEPCIPPEQSHGKDGGGGIQGFDNLQGKDAAAA